MEKILLTGSNGFLGKYIKYELSKNSRLLTLSRFNSDIMVDLVIDTPILSKVDMVIHCAGKAHTVPTTEFEKKSFFDVNVKGTENLLKGLSQVNDLPKSFVLISSVAVYGCETGVLISEEQPLNATDPYGLSKIQSEQLVLAWCAENKVICSILRLPLLVGDCPPGNLGAMINGIKKGYYFNIGSGNAKKSMVLAADVAKLIPRVAEIGGVYNLTDGYHPNFDELSAKIALQLNKKKPYNIPLWLAKIIAKIGDLLGDILPINTNKLNKITSDLTFNDSKARIKLNWNPLPVMDSFKQ